MPPFSPMDRLAPAKPTPWKVSSTILQMSVEESSHEPLKTSSSTSTVAMTEKYNYFYQGYLHGSSILHPDLQLSS